MSRYYNKNPTNSTPSSVQHCFLKVQSGNPAYNRLRAASINIRQVSAIIADNITALFTLGVLWHEGAGPGLHSIPELAVRLIMRGVVRHFQIPPGRALLLPGFSLWSLIYALLPSQHRSSRTMQFADNIFSIAHAWEAPWGEAYLYLCKVHINSQGQFADAPAPIDTIHEAKQSKATAALGCGEANLRALRSIST